MLTTLLPIVALAFAFQSAPAGDGTAPPPPPVAAGWTWPQTIELEGKSCQVFEPVVVGIQGSVAQLVTQVTMPGSGGGMVTGKATLSAAMYPADVPGEVEFNGFRVQSLTAGGASAPDADVAALGRLLGGLSFTLDRASVAEHLQIQNARSSSTPGLGTAAPNIVVTDVPTLLVQLTGEPVLVLIGSGNWNVVRNTPFVMLQAPDRSFWVRVGGQWLTSPKLRGDYLPAGSTPPADVIAALGTAPPPPIDAATNPPSVTPPAAPATPPALCVRTVPTVLVSTNGAAKTAVVAPGVTAIANTSATVLSPDDGMTWFLYASGRWFRTGDLMNGSWNYVAPFDVPKSFAGLPSKKRWDGVRASVPGTPEANEATLAAREVRTVTINRNGPQCSVRFLDNRMAWQKVGTSTVSYCTNATQPVLTVGDGRMYCCDSGVWFVSPIAQPQWSVCDKVPAAIYQIPPSCPAYPATYVEVYAATADSVTFGATAGYYGTYLNDGTPVYGTGIGMTGYGAGSSYVAYPQTYGSDAAYDSQSGTFMPPDDPNDDGAYYGAVDVNPMWMNDWGWTGWGWCPGWNNAWAAGWGNWYGWDNWSRWSNHWNPYNNRWADQHHPWQRQNAADAAARTAQRNLPADQRNWPAARGAGSDAARATVRSSAGSDATQARRTDAATQAAAENQDALRRQYQGAAGDAPASFRGPGDEYGGYSRDAYRPWTGTGTAQGGNWGYSPLARPNGFAPPQQFAAPGAYWGSGTAQGNRTGPNAGPYTTPQGHGGYGSYDRWGGEGERR